MESVTRKTALVVGGLGLAGRAILEHLTALPEWEVIGLARRRPDFETSARFISVDLMDAQACRAALQALPQITHVFYAAMNWRGNATELVDSNLAMLSNIVEAAEAACPGLEHVSLMQGTKSYGAILGPFRTPARETDPRIPPPLYYYDQEDWLRARQQAKAWHWSLLRPGGIVGFAIGAGSNLVSVLAAYGSMCRALNLPLYFPGTREGFSALRQAIDSELLARIAVWAATTAAARNQILNVGNGEPFRLEHLWPRLAEFFGVAAGPVMQLRLSETMADKAPLWQAMVQRHGLRAYTLDQVTTWRYADYFHNGWDNFASTLKLRQLGFHEVRDNEQSLLQALQRLRTEGVIP